MKYIKTTFSSKHPSKDKTILVASDTPKFYWKVQYKKEDKRTWDIYIAVNQTEIKPIILEEKNIIFIAVEQGVFVLDIHSGSVISNISDTSYAQSIEKTSLRILLVSAEDEVLAFSPSGFLIWRTTFPDIIENIEDNGSKIKILDFSGEKYLLDLYSGKLD